ncbi:S26 family signal peptidase [Celeribacter naphthalenivorans]|uniref:S26 family signal peptidase n=1 Tax=Celeribacter naphthalenivorans TaxID=1614694 RepID=UPI001CFB2E87|nr:S26 family signal peptidase [Celeribacter naphthalenivorans]
MKGFLKWSFVAIGSMSAAIGFWALHDLRITLNGSDSLPENAFVMWTWPQVIWRGAVISAVPPEAYAEHFEGVYFTKRVIGKPGDLITHDGGALCVETDESKICFKAIEREGQAFAPLTAEGVIPAGMYAAFGTTENSLDSRYSTVGLFPKENIIAVGVGANWIPHWKEIKAWSDARGS